MKKEDQVDKGKKDDKDRPDNNKPELFVDNERYQWDKESISGAEIRTLASLPQDVEIFQKVPGAPDAQIKDDTIVDLTATKGPDRFCSQTVGSEAG